MASLKDRLRAGAAGSLLGQAVLGPAGGLVGAGLGALRAKGSGVGSAPGMETITIEGVEYDVPEGFDPETFRRQMAAEEGILSGLEGQVAEAERAIGTIQQAEEAGVSELRRQAAQALAGSQGLTRTGKGFALARSAGEQAATREATLRADFAQQLADARQAAAAARTEKAIEEGKLAEAETMRRQGAAMARAEVESITEKHKGTLFTTKGDKKRMARDIRELLAVETNPYAAEVYTKALRDLERGMNVQGSIDINAF